MLYGDGDGRTFTKPLVVLDVTGHELSHGVVDATANLKPTRVDIEGNQFGEPGSLNESLADIFGSAVEFSTNNPKNPPNYLLGEKLGLDQKFLRRLDKPSLDKLEGAVDYWSKASYDTEVHMRLRCLLARLLPARRGQREEDHRRRCLQLPHP